MQKLKYLFVVLSFNRMSFLARVSDIIIYISIITQIRILASSRISNDVLMMH